MPPPSGHENGLARLLDKLVHLDVVSVLLSNPGQQVHEVVDSFIIFTCFERNSKMNIKKQAKDEPSKRKMNIEI